MEITNLNPDPDIGASCWSVTLDGFRLLLDAGTHPKRDGRAGLPLYSRLPPGEVDAIAISHCHHDHVGSLPVALRHFPHAHVLMTELSYFIVERVLHNSVNVMKRKKAEANIPEYPLFSHHEVDDLASVFQGFRYNREIEWAAFEKSTHGRHSPTLEFFDAGHALGSAGILVRGRNQTLFYTGDVNFQDQTLLRGARFEDTRADVLILETTRGGKPTPPGFTREAEVDRLAEAINRARARRGAILIPTFALGRTQEILALLALLMRAGKLKRQPVYIGGLGRVFTEIYDLEAHRANRNHSNLQLSEALELVVLGREETDAFRLKDGKLLVLTAGMMTENTTAHEIAARMIGDKRQSIFFVGYADPDSPAGRLRAAAQDSEFFFSEPVGDLRRRCHLDEFDLTAHASREELLEFVGQVDPHTVILGHGDAPARAWFAEEIAREFPKKRLLQPGPAESVEA